MFTGVDYVSFETAKLLKEKGFDEFTVGFYGSKRGLYIGSSSLYNSINNRVTFANNLHKVQYEDVIAAAPTLYEAQMWLMEELGLCIVVSPYVYVDEYDDEGYPCGTAMYWEVSIYSMSDGFQRKLDRCYDIYEDAFDKGIQEALKMI